MVMQRMTVPPNRQILYQANGCITGLGFCRAQKDGGKGKMLYDTRRFVFTVSLCAMLAVNPVLATAPGEEELVSTVHDVYTESTNTGTDTTLNLSSGIAGVTYVNRMVNSAGNAAQRAEEHAAAAGASAIAAQTAADDAQSAADAAKNTLKDKVDISQGTDNKDKVMVVGDDGDLTPGMVGASAIADSAVTMHKIDAVTNYYGGAYGHSGVLGFYSGYGVSGLYWNQVHSGMIADGAVTMNKISANGEYGVSSGVLMFYSGSYPGQSGLYWSQVDTNVIADGAVTPAQTAGVVGAIPWGAADSTTYGQFWIE